MPAQWCKDNSWRTKIVRWAYRALTPHVCKKKMCAVFGRFCWHPTQEWSVRCWSVLVLKLWTSLDCPCCNLRTLLSCCLGTLGLGFNEIQCSVFRIRVDFFIHFKDCTTRLPEQIKQIELSPIVYFFSEHIHVHYNEPNTSNTRLNWVCWVVFQWKS